MENGIIVIVSSSCGTRQPLKIRPGVWSASVHAQSLMLQPYSTTLNTNICMLQPYSTHAMQPRSSSPLMDDELNRQWCVPRFGSALTPLANETIARRSKASKVASHCSCRSRICPIHFSFWLRLTHKFHAAAIALPPLPSVVDSSSLEVRVACTVLLVRTLQKTSCKTSHPTR